MLKPSTSKTPEKRVTLAGIFTLVELLVVISIIAILAALLLPALAKARESSRMIVCAGNLKQVGVALNFYNSDHGDFFPPWYATINGVTEYWPRIFALAGYAQNPGRNNMLFRCQSSKFDHHANAAYSPWGQNCNYAYNSELGVTNYNTYYTNGPAKMSKIKTPSQVATICESGDRSYSDDPVDCAESIGAQGIPDGNTWGMLAYPHNSLTNLSWIDGHVSVLRHSQISKSYWIPVPK